MINEIKICVKNCGSECPFYEVGEFNEICKVNFEESTIFDMDTGFIWDNGFRKGFPKKCSLKNNTFIISRITLLKEEL